MRFHSRKSPDSQTPVNPLTEERGSLSLAGALLTGTVAVLGFGLVGLIAHWHRLARDQLEIDRCVSTTARELRTWASSAESDDRRMKALRLALAPSTLLPPVRASLQAALQAVYLHQEYILVRYRATQARWMIRRGCDGKSSDLPVPIRFLPVRRDPPDATGPQALTWNRASIFIQLSRKSRPPARSFPKAQTRRPLPMMKPPLLKNSSAPAHSASDPATGPFAGKRLTPFPPSRRQPGRCHESRAGQVFLEVCLWSALIACAACSLGWLSAHEHERYRTTVREFQNLRAGSEEGFSLSRPLPGWADSPRAEPAPEH